MTDGRGKISERIKLLIGDLSLRKFAEKVGVNEATLRGILKEKRPYLDTMAAIAKGAGVDFKWLATGEGSPEGGEEADMYVPLHNVRAAAGAGAWNDDETVVTMVPFSRRFVRELGGAPEHLHLIEAHGNSMEPTILSGDWLLVDTSQRDPRLAGIYVLRRDNEVQVKRLRPRPAQGIFEVRSDNEEQYPRRELTRAQDLDIIGRVIWIMRQVR